MKTAAFSFLVLLTASIQAQTIQEFFQKADKDVYWMGIDFSHVQLVGEFAHFFGAGEKGPEELATHYFPAWNDLIFNEPNKYDIRGMLHKPNMKYDLSYVQSLNDAVEAESLKVKMASPYSEEQIKQFLADYHLEGKTGFGVALVAESLDKTKKKAIFHLVIINLESRECLFDQPLQGSPQGFGVRNYWGGAIHNVIDMGTTKYRGWSNKYK